MNHLLGQNMTAGYTRQVDILHNCTIEVLGGEIVTIVGPNGAGKSTAMKTLLGLLPLRIGQVLYDDEDISNIPTQVRISKGIGFVPQNRNIFTEMTVQENLQMGAFLRQGDCLSTENKVLELFPILKSKYKQLAGELSGGQRQQVAIARVLMNEPKILLLDEPTAGVSPIVMEELFERMELIKKTGVGILMVEQNATQALEVADRGYVLALGENFKTGTGQELLNDNEVRQSFLGG